MGQLGSAANLGQAWWIGVGLTHASAVSWYRVASDGMVHLCSVLSLILLQASLGISTCGLRRVPRQQVDKQELLRPRLGTGVSSLLQHSAGQSGSRGQSRFKG